MGPVMSQGHDFYAATINDVGDLASSVTDPVPSRQTFSGSYREPSRASVDRSVASGGAEARPGAYPCCGADAHVCP